VTSIWRGQFSARRCQLVRVRVPRSWAIVFWIGASTLVVARSAGAQGLSISGSLGGYGAASSGSLAAMSGSSSPIIPYAGSFGGFMPYRMGGGGGLSFSSRNVSVMDSRRASFSLAPISGRMSSTTGGMRQGLITGAQSFRGMGLGSGMSRQSSGRESMRVMPPSFGYPFYQPPSLVEPLSTGAGMSSM
jgi:hypothetical protein